MTIKYFRHPEAPPGAPPVAVRAGDFIFFAGGIAAHPTRGIPDEVKPQRGFPYHWSSIERQLRYIYRNMSETLEKAGSSIKQGMKINSYHTNPADVDAALKLRKDFFGAETPPPSTLIFVPETAVRGTSVTNDIIALATDAKLPREAFHQSTEKTPLPAHDLIFGRPIFVQAIRGGGFVFTAGKGPVRADGAIPEIYGHPDFPYRNNQIKIQTEYILSYFKSLFKEMGVSFDDVVKADLHMCNMKDIAGMDEVWGKFFPHNPPARSIHVSGLAVINMVIEIELFAVDPKGPYRKEVISTAKAPQPIGHEAQAVKAGPFLFLSGQLATDYKQGVPPEARVDANFPYHSSSVKRQVKYILKNVEAICQAAGTSTKNLVRRRAMHFDLNELAEAEEAWSEALGDRLPPTTIFRTVGPLPVPGCTVGYDLTAYID